MARRGKPGPGQGQFNFEDAGSIPVGRTPKFAPQRASDQPLKLHTPEVFTSEQDAQPREWVAVDSTRVSQMRYDDGLSQIQVYFADGTPWVYQNVPEEVYEMFLTSSSKGRFINDVLNTYPYRRAGANESMSW